MQFNASFALRFPRNENRHAQKTTRTLARVSPSRSYCSSSTCIPAFSFPATAHFDGFCKTIPLDQNAEDLRIDPTNGLVYLTYGTGVIGTTGTVMLLDPNAAEPHVRAALASDPSGFSPSGLSLYTPSSGTKRLFVTSRTRLGSHSVEIFDQSPTGAFTPVETIRDSLLWSSTAIVAVGPRQFYVVNQLGFKRAYRRQRGERVRPAARQPEHGRYYDGEQMKIVASGLGLASGMALSPDGRHGVRGGVVTRSDLRSSIAIPANGSLKRTGQIRVRGSPHNLATDADGALWVSLHPLARCLHGLHAG